MPTEAEETIAKVFYDRKSGFQGLEQTYRQAHELDPSVTREQVKTFLANQEVRQGKKPAKSELNSFVADFPRQQFQIDLLDMGRTVKPFRYGFVCIDIFTKKAECVPIRKKEPSITAQALQEIFTDMGYPTTILSDSGAEFKGAFAEVCRKEGVNMLKSITGARFAERFIRYLKNALIQRTRALGGRWHSYIHDIIDHYNSTVHSSTGFAPDDIAKHEYDMDVLIDAHKELMKHAKFNVKHPGISVGDYVKVRVKQTAFYKETDESWTSTSYSVSRVEDSPDGKKYYLDGQTKPFLRFELKKVNDVQYFANNRLQSRLRPVPVVEDQPARDVVRRRRLIPIREEPKFDFIPAARLSRLRPLRDVS